MNPFLLHLDAHALNENDITTGEHEATPGGEKVLFFETLQVINPLISRKIQVNLNQKIMEKHDFTLLRDCSTECFRE